MQSTLHLYFVIMATQILQWNARGLLRNLDDIKELLQKYNPKVLCIQETHLKSINTNFLNSYVIFRKDRENALASAGGVAIITINSIASQQLMLQTPLEAVAIRAIVLNKLVTICSIYIPPDYKLNSLEFQSLINQLPEPFILLGDFNAHNPLWGDPRCDARGRMIEKFLLNSGACLLNKKEPTFYSMTHNSYSAIDLAICSATLLPCLEWDVIKNLYGSDHFPICLKSSEQLDLFSRTPRWKLESADWEKFHQMTQMPRNALNDFNINDAVTFFTAFITDAAFECIPQTNGAPKKRRVPWWNEDCKTARKNKIRLGACYESPQPQKIS